MRNAAFADHWGSTLIEADSQAFVCTAPGRTSPSSPWTTAAGDVIGLTVNQVYPEDDEVTGRQDAWIANIGTSGGHEGAALRAGDGRLAAGRLRRRRTEPRFPCSTSIPTAPRAPPASTGPRFRAPPPVGDLRDRGHQPVGLTVPRAAASRTCVPFPCYGRACSPSRGSSPASRTRSAGRWSTTVATRWWWRAPAPARPPRSPPVSPASSPRARRPNGCCSSPSAAGRPPSCCGGPASCAAPTSPAGRGAARSTPSPTGCSGSTDGRSASTPPSPCSTRATPPTCSPSAGRSSTPTSGARPGPSAGPPARTRWPPSSAGASTPRRRCRRCSRHFRGAGRSATS